MKVELPQTRCASMDVQDAEEALMGQLGEVASAVPPTGHAGDVSSRGCQAQGDNPKI